MFRRNSRDQAVKLTLFRSIEDDTQTSADEDLIPECSSVHKRSEPEPSCVSMKNDASMGPSLQFMSGDTHPGLSPVQWKRSEQEPTSVSMNSDKSIIQPLQFNSGDTRPGLSHEVLNTFRSNLKKKFEHLYEGTAMQENPTLLNEIYTELYITETLVFMIAVNIFLTCTGDDPLSGIIFALDAVKSVPKWRAIHGFYLLLELIFK
ncbi:hypothetical protein QQF64_035897 [Cirrhinus molitorella]|uniref:FISNA domain-containing protein n=1 Tax=Cirrhinus molitorella TaxID=172907 RepID=A0ABR3NH77_9TELE